MRRILFLSALLILTAAQLSAQQLPFWNEVAEIVLADAAAPKPRGEILFAGSSSFTMWKDADKSFPGKTIINVGYGGSTLQDQIRYVDYVITPYAPRQIVLYCGENDIAYDSTVTGHDVLNRFAKLVELIRHRFPRVHISYVAMKPSPSREKLLPVFSEGNRLIKEYLKGVKRTSYINVFDVMLDEAGRPRHELFLEDMLHMNDTGYAAWIELIKPHLK
ncbi:MAG: hypothetical protein KF845_06260 [Cyclobacteriaceae bacterium]|nr:hypothetical protein [Cyclobacteriaceae bacterium]